MSICLVAGKRVHAILTELAQPVSLKKRPELTGGAYGTLASHKQNTQKNTLHSETQAPH